MNQVVMTGRFPNFQGIVTLQNFRQSMCAKRPETNPEEAEKCRQSDLLRVRVHACVL